MEYQALLDESLEELRLKTQAHDRLWQISQSDWHVDQLSGQITFTTPNGVTATCPVQILGTFNSEDSTWLWGWDHPSVQEPLRVYAQVFYE